MPKISSIHFDSTSGAVQMTLLPGYSPELNPVEYWWAWRERHVLVTFCQDTLGDLKATARNKRCSAQHSGSITSACWKQAELWRCYGLRKDQ